MPEVVGLEKLLSFVAKKKFGGWPQYGTSQFGYSHFGDDDVSIEVVGQPPILLSGIYRTDNVTGQTRNYRQPYRIVRNPRSELQQANRQKMADGVIAWRGLTDYEKNQYNKNAVRKGMSGYNLFLHEYLRSH